MASEHSEQPVDPRLQTSVGARTSMAHFSRRVAEGTMSLFDGQLADLRVDDEVIDDGWEHLATHPRHSAVRLRSQEGERVGACGVGDQPATYHGHIRSI